MTRRANATVAGATFLIYIAAGISSMVLFRHAVGSGGVIERLAGVAQHPGTFGIVLLLGLVQSFSALVLAMTLWAITRDVDPDIAMLGLICRVIEGAIAALAVSDSLSLRWLATATGIDAPEAVSRHALGAYLLNGGAALSATFFAVGSTAFAWLLLRGRLIPTLLAWIGVVASVLLAVALPLQLAGFLHGPITAAVWLPMLAFEVPVAVWFLAKGVARPVATASQSS
jgi:hypothetical protein